MNAAEEVKRARPTPARDAGAEIRDVLDLEKIAREFDAEECRSMAEIYDAWAQHLRAKAAFMDGLERPAPAMRN